MGIIQAKLNFMDFDKKYVFISELSIEWSF